MTFSRILEQTGPGSVGLTGVLGQCSTLTHLDLIYSKVEVTLTVRLSFRSQLGRRPRFQSPSHTKVTPNQLKYYFYYNG